MNIATPEAATRYRNRELVIRLVRDFAKARITEKLAKEEQANVIWQVKKFELWLELTASWEDFCRDYLGCSTQSADLAAEKQELTGCPHDDVIANRGGLA